MKTIILSSREANKLSNVSSITVLALMFLVFFANPEQHLLQATLSFVAFVLNLCAYLEISKIYKGYVETSEKQKDQKSGIAALSLLFALLSCYFVACSLGF